MKHSLSRWEDESNEIFRTQTIHMLTVFSRYFFLPSILPHPSISTCIWNCIGYFVVCRLQSTSSPADQMGRTVLWTQNHWNKSKKQKNWKTTVCRYCILFDALHSIYSIMCDIWRSVFISMCMCVFGISLFPTPLCLYVCMYWNAQITQITHHISIGLSSANEFLCSFDA